MANLQNYKRVKIRMDDMISQQFFRLQNLCYVYNICNFNGSQIVVFCWRYMELR
jgi:hypothetical protein